MAIKLHNVTLIDNDIGISVPDSWTGDIEASMVHFERNGRAIEVRDAITDQKMTVPPEIARLALETYAAHKDRGQATAIAKVAEQHSIRKFLLEHGYQAANLLVAVGSLVAGIIKP